MSPQTPDNIKWTNILEENKPTQGKTPVETENQAPRQRKRKQEEQTNKQNQKQNTNKNTRNKNTKITQNAFQLINTEHMTTADLINETQIIYTKMGKK